MLKEKVTAVTRLAGGRTEYYSDYPAWEYRAESKLRELFCETYSLLYDEKPRTAAIHAGLECGLFTEKFPGLDMVSFGPTLRGVHAPGERLDLASLDKFVALLVDVVTNYR